MGLLAWLRARFGPAPRPVPKAKDERMHYVVAWVEDDERGDGSKGWRSACGVFRPRRMTRVPAHATCAECRDRAWVRGARRLTSVR